MRSAAEDERFPPQMDRICVYKDVVGNITQIAVNPEASHKCTIREPNPRIPDVVKSGSRPCLYGFWVWVIRNPNFEFGISAPNRARALSQANRAHPCHTLAGSRIFPVLPKLQHSSFGCRSFGWGGAGGRRLFGGPVLRASVSGLGSLHGCLQSRV